jgi:hypothetical protein
VSTTCTQDPLHPMKLGPIYHNWWITRNRTTVTVLVPCRLILYCTGQLRTSKLRFSFFPNGHHSNQGKIQPKFIWLCPFETSKLRFFKSQWTDPHGTICVSGSPARQYNTQFTHRNVHGRDGKNQILISVNMKVLH